MRSTDAPGWGISIFMRLFVMGNCLDESTTTELALIHEVHNTAYKIIFIL